MLRVAEINDLLQSSPSANNFKYWAEVILDFLLIGLFLMVILSWQNIFYTEFAGLTCVATNENSENIALSDDRYTTSRCLIDSPARFLLFYPYFQFLQFILLTLGQVMWLYVPKVKSKLDLYNDIFKRISQIEPNFEATGEFTPKLVLDEKNREATTLIFDKLFFLITEKGCIVRYFIGKNVINLLLSLIFIVLNMFWTVLISKNGVDFSCNLSSSVTEKSFTPRSCNVSPFYYFIGYLCLFEFLLILFLVFTIINLFSFCDARNFESHVCDLFGPGGDRLYGLPGFFDFALYVTMHNKNIKDGGFQFQMIKLVINTHNTISDNLSSMLTKKSDSPRKTEKFNEELSILSNIAEKLQMKVRLKPFKQNHIYDCIKELISLDQKIDLTIIDNVESVILNEIKANPLYYVYLLTGFFNNKVDKVIEALNIFDNFVKNLEKKEIWPNNIILAAVANLFSVKIVVVKTHIKSEFYVDNIDIFEPYSQIWNGNIAIFSLIQPHYYNLLEYVYSDVPQVIEERKLFVTNREFRLRMIDQARKGLLKHILLKEQKCHKKVKSLISLNISETNQHPLNENYSQTLFNSRKILPKYKAIRYYVGNQTVKFQGIF